LSGVGGAEPANEHEIRSLRQSDAEAAPSPAPERLGEKDFVTRRGTSLHTSPRRTYKYVLVHIDQADCVFHCPKKIGRRRGKFLKERREISVKYNIQIYNNLRKMTKKVKKECKNC
jgi:hypothetical protein